MAEDNSASSASSKDIVTLYTLPSTLRAVTYSPPCLKLETFLRMAKIPFKSVNDGFKPSTKGKMPWIEYKGQAVPDSNFCIEFLSKEFGVDLDGHLTAEERAVARAFQVMLDENTFWAVVNQVFNSDHSYTLWNEAYANTPAPLRMITLWIGRSRSNNYMHAHGIGRHSQEEFYHIAERDLRAVSTQLGEKNYLFGNKPSVPDTCLFGILSFFLYEYPESPQGCLIREHLPNLTTYADRIKQTYFPDWDKIIKDKSKH